VLQDVRLNSLDPGAKHVYSLPHFKLDNVYPIFEKYFNGAAKKAMQTKTDSFYYSYYVDHGTTNKLMTLLSHLNLRSAKEAVDKNLFSPSIAMDKIHFFAIRCERTDIVKAVEHMILSINHLADKGFIKASMVELGVIKFEHVPGKADEVAVLSYLSLDKNGENYVGTFMPNLIVAEGCVPTRLEELK
jgi:hypothetical protein